MAQFRFRPQLAEFEDRLTPSTSPTEVLEAAALIEQHAAALNWFANNLDTKTVFLRRSELAQSLPGLSNANGGAAFTLSRFVVDAQQVIAEGRGNAQLPAYISQVNELIAKGFANQQYAASLALNFGASPNDFLPPVPPPPPPPPEQTPTFDDSELSTSIPDTTQGFQDVGDGLQIKDVKIGVNAVVTPGQTVTVDYTGWLLDGTVFDSSVNRGQPATFSLNQVIEGWQRGIPGMQPGGIRQLIIPSALAYGATGSPPSIPPNSDLVFEVRMRSATDPVPTINNNELPPGFDVSTLFNN